MEPKNKQYTKNQHYVPVYYLKRFTNSDDKLEVLDLKPNKVMRPRSPKTVCHEKDFYSTYSSTQEENQALEEEFSQSENSLAQSLPGVIEKLMKGERIIEKDLKVIGEVMTSQHLRPKSMLDYIDKYVLENAEKHEGDLPNKFQGQDIRLAKRKATEMIKKGEYSRTIHQGIFSESPNYFGMIQAKHYRFYVLRSDAEFITSDNPSFDLSPNGSSTNPRSFSFTERIHQMALTPKILVRAVEPIQGQRRVKVVDLHDNKEDNQKILELNLDCVDNATQYVYASSREVLDELVVCVNRIRKQQRQFKISELCRDLFNYSS